MALFWVGAVVMITVALLLILRPLVVAPRKTGTSSRKATNVAVFRERLAEIDLSRDDGALTEEEYAAARAEIERTVIAEATEEAVPAGPLPAANPVVAVVVALAIPAIAAGLYLQLGSPAALRTDAATATASAGEPHATQEIVSRLEARLREEPENVEGWMLLARSYTALQRFPDARRAYGRAYELEPEEAGVILRLAAATARVNGNNLRGEPEALINKALEIAPDAAFGLWLAGFAARQRNDPAAALGHWKRLVETKGVSGRELEQIEENIAELEKLVGNGAATAPPPPPGGAVAVSVQVSLAPELAARTEPTDTVFVFARAADGPKIPLAIVRRQAKDLPLSVTLDDSMAMQPGLSLSRFPDLVIAARVSKSGSAVPASGDLEGSSRASLANQGPVMVSINEVVP